MIGHSFQAVILCACLLCPVESSPAARKSGGKNGPVTDEAELARIKQQAVQDALRQLWPVRADWGKGPILGQRRGDSSRRVAQHAGTALSQTSSLVPSPPRLRASIPRGGGVVESWSCSGSAGLESEPVCSMRFA